MSLRLYNVRTRQKEEFQSLEKGKVGIYVCGLTVYDHMHIGHARTAFGFEIVRRWMERTYGAQNVRFVQNVTDVDDKIIARAVELGVSPLEHADTWDKECAAQAARLGVRPPDEAPHATKSMDGIVSYIEAILARNFAYATDEGNVYFDVPRYDAFARAEFPGYEYGTLSNRDYREMAAGTRKAVETDKRHPADFALWKAAKTGEPDDAQWDSPWGKGRPGWHIECSHMSTHSLGADQIDIHGGGQDLIFPHHENEIAQTQAKTGKAPFVNVWMHAGFLNVDGVKMSKSLGNFITLKQMLDELQKNGDDPEVLRLYFAQTHYRSKIDFSRRGLDEARTAWASLERTRRLLFDRAATGDKGQPEDTHESVHAFAKDFADAMDDDIHTPNALAALFRFQKAIHRAEDAGALDAASAHAALEEWQRAGDILTLFQTPLAPSVDFDVLLQEREAARANKDWGEADRIRDEIASAGYRIEDTPQGPRVVPA